MPLHIMDTFYKVFTRVIIFKKKANNDEKYMYVYFSVMNELFFRNE